MKPLRILHVCTSDRIGGASRAAHRLHLAQRHAGLDSHMLVLNRTEQSEYVHAPFGKAARLAQVLKRVISTRLLERQITPSNTVLHSMNRFNNGLGQWINQSEFDIVNLHWLGAELISVDEIARIRQPVVWTMHDMWPFCGAEHYDDPVYPGRYLSRYTAANRPETYVGPDLDAQTWGRKQRAWQGKTFHLVSPSNWLATCAQESALMGHQQCAVIPNCLDTNCFKPVDRRIARQILNLNPDKRYILFGAMASTSDPRKGFQFLKPALQMLGNHEQIASDTELLVFGANGPDEAVDLGLPVHYMGHFHDDVSLALLYSAADVFAAPSTQDNLPNTLVESLACGTPCVAFNVGGMPDLISSEVCGALIHPFDVSAFTQALIQILTRPPVREHIQISAREKYSPEAVVPAYVWLYQQLLPAQRKVFQ